MQQLLRLSMLLVGGFSVMLMVAQQIGQTAPLPKIAHFWHLYDCELPCWAGIVLQQTTHEVAKDRLLTLFGAYAPRVTQSSSTGFLITLHDSIGKLTGTIRARGDRGVVATITLEVIDSDAQQFMQVTQAYGLPTCARQGIFTNNNDFTVMFDRPQAGVRVTVSQTLRLTPIFVLTIGEGLSSCRDDYPAWHGFTYR